MPGVANPAGLSITYNGYTFPVSVEPVRVSMRDRPDSAKRANTAVEYTITLSATIYPEGDEVWANEQMANLRRRLSKPACELLISGTGFGDGLSVNRQGGTVWDAEWGPWPKVLECTQLGDNLAWKIVWQVVTVVPEECPEETRAKRRRMLEWCYTVSWDVDEKGLTTRTVNGHVVIPLTRPHPDSTIIPDHADVLTEAVKNLTVPDGFRRIPGRRQLSEDRRRLDFTVTDRQLDSPWSPPPGVILCSGSHRVSNGSGNNWLRYQHVLSASYTVGRDVPKSDAWRHFRDLWTSRWLRPQRDRRFWLMPLTLSMNERLWDMTTDFTLTYLAVAAGDARLSAQVNRLNAMQNAVNFSGLWLPPPSSFWFDWHRSLAGTAMESRGYAKLRFMADDDQIQDPCEPPLPAKPRPNPEQQNPKGGGNKPGGGGGNKPGNPTPPTRPSGPELGRLPVQPPPPDDSWLDVKTRITIVPRDDVPVLKLLPRNGKPVKYNPKKGDVDTSPGGFTPDFNPPATPPVVIQFRAEPEYRLVFEGEVVRAGYKVPTPVLTEAGGVKVWPVRAEGDYFTQEFGANLLSPVVFARWRMTYVFESTPRVPVGPPDHPVHGAFAGQDDRLEGFTAGAVAGA